MSSNQLTIDIKTPKRAASDCHWTPPQPKARRSVIYDDGCHASILLPDLCTPDSSRRRPLSYRPQLPESFFEATSFKDSSEFCDACPPALPLCNSDCSTSDSSMEQSFLASESVMVSFDDCESGLDVPSNINLRPRFSFDGFGSSGFWDGA